MHHSFHASFLHVVAWLVGCMLLMKLIPCSVDECFDSVAACSDVGCVFICTCNI